MGVEESQVGQIGEGVVEGHAFDLLGLYLLLRHVQAHPQDTPDLPLPPDGGDDLVQADLPPLPDLRLLPLVDLSLQDLAVRLPPEAAGLLRQSGMLLHRLAQQVSLSLASPVVLHQHPALLVPDPQLEGGVGEESLQERLLLLKAGLGLLPLREVPEEAHDRPVGEKFAAHLHPKGGPPGAQKPPLPGDHPASQHLLVHQGGRDQVVRVEQLLHRAGKEVLRRGPHQLAESAVRPHHPRVPIQLQKTVGGLLHQDAQPLLVLEKLGPCLPEASVHVQKGGQEKPGLGTLSKTLQRQGGGLLRVSGKAAHGLQKDGITLQKGGEDAEADEEAQDQDEGPRQGHAPQVSPQCPVQIQDVGPGAQDTPDLRQPRHVGKLVLRFRGKGKRVEVADLPLPSGAGDSDKLLLQGQSLGIGEIRLFRPLPLGKVGVHPQGSVVIQEEKVVGTVDVPVDHLPDHPHHQPPPFLPGQLPITDPGQDGAQGGPSNLYQAPHILAALLQGVHPGLRGQDVQEEAEGGEEHPQREDETEPGSIQKGETFSHEPPRFGNVKACPLGFHGTTPRCRAASFRRVDFIVLHRNGPRKLTPSPPPGGFERKRRGIRGTKKTG